MDKSTHRRSTLGTRTLGTMRSTMDNHEDRKEAPNLGKHKINEAPKLSSDDKEEMIYSYQEIEMMERPDDAIQATAMKDYDWDENELGFLDTWLQIGSNNSMDLDEDKNGEQVDAILIEKEHKTECDGNSFIDTRLQIGSNNSMELDEDKNGEQVDAILIEEEHKTECDGNGFLDTRLQIGSNNSMDLDEDKWRTG